MDILENYCFKIAEEYLTLDLATNDLVFDIQADTSCTCNSTGGNAMVKIAPKNTSYKVIQGDTLRILVSCNEIGVFGEGWGGKWGIKRYKGEETLIAEDELVFSDDRKYMIANLTHEKTKTLPSGELILIIAVKNEAESFHKQVLNGVLTVTPSELPFD